MTAVEKVLLVFAIVSWAVAVNSWFMARDWQKIANEQARLSQRYAAMLTESIKMTDVALTSDLLRQHEVERYRAELATRGTPSEEPSKNQRPN